MKYQSKVPIKNSNRKKLVGILLVLALVAGTGLVFMQTRNSSPVTQGTNPAGTEELNLDPPTEEELQATEQHKQQIADQEQAGSTSPTGSDRQTGPAKQSVTPIFGFLQQAGNGNVEANGYLTEAVESDGSCTLTLTRNGQQVSVAKQAMPDAQSTICGLMTIERAKLTPGQWSATISYSSAKHQGVSEAKLVEVK